MSIWYDGTNLNMYRGDSGSLVFTGLPCCPGYRVFFSVKSIKSGDIIFECSGEPENYYIDNEGELICKEPGESEEDFIYRCEQMVESGSAMKRGKCRIFITPDKTEKLFVAKGQTQNEYYYGLKICFSSTGIENTLIPQTKFDEETGEIIFKNPPKLILKPKYTEGTLPCECMDDIDVVAQNPKDYGIQPLLTESENIVIDQKTDVIDISDELSAKISQVDRIDGLEERITDVENDISVLSRTVSEHGTHLEQVDESLASQEHDIENQAVKIRALEQTVGNYRGGLVKSVNTINDKLSTYGDIVTHNVDEFQAKLTPDMGIEITDGNISVNLGIEQLNNVLIEDLQDGDILMYSAGLGKWINRQLP